MSARAYASRASTAVLAATAAFGTFAPASHAEPKKTTNVAALPAMSYRVGSGDTLTSISRRTGVPAPAIARANGMTAGGQVQAGHRLLVPAAQQQTDNVHVVTRRQTLSHIARQYGSSVDAIASANSIADPARIYPGQRLVIPSSQEAGGQSAVSSQQGAATYTVVGGDTLSAIARRHGTSVSAIASANSISDPARIYPGQQLTIPGAQEQTQLASAPTTAVPKTFLHYTYSDETNSAANQNKAALESAAAPSPAQMQEMVRSTAVEMGVDPQLAMAHAYVESGFDMRAVSPANAVGVMQVIPSSGKWASTLVGRELNLLDPQDNVIAGIAIIRYLQNNADSVEQGIAGYYQGLGGVRKNGMRPDTQTYVSKVLAAKARF